MSIYKSFDSNSTDKHILGQAWHQYNGTEMSCSPRQSFIASLIQDILANDITIAVFMDKSNNKESFYAIGEKHWIDLNTAYDIANSDMIKNIEFILDSHERGDM